MVVVRHNDAVWQTKCPDNPGGRAGWSEVSASASFTSSMPSDNVIGEINTVLVRQGWTRRDEVLTRGQGPVSHWFKHVGVGKLADATLFPVPAGSTDWVLYATWQPPGFALPGC